MGKEGDFVLEKVFKRFIIKRDLVFAKIAKVEMDPDLISKLEEDLVNKDVKEEYKESITKFVKTVNENSNFDMRIFCLHFKDLTIKNINFYDKMHSFMASYDAQKNQMRLNPENYRKAIFHELFHVISGVYKGLASYEGFSICLNFIGSFCLKFGVGLNEGYTELLANRYFADENLFSSPIEVYLIQFLENIIGQDKMENWYSTANLKSLLSELKKYQTEEEILEFLEDMDYIYFNSFKKVIPPQMRVMVLNIAEFLLQTYNKQQNMSFLAGEISFTEYKNKVLSFAQNLYQGIDFNKDNYNFIKSSENEHLMENSFSKLSFGR